MNDIKKIIDENKNKLNSKNKENNILKEKVEEMQKIILTQKNENKDIISTYEKYKNEKDNEIRIIKAQNDEMKSEIQFLITEYENIKAQNDKYQQGLLKFNQLMNLSGLGGAI
jgi:peptidoglycan hydrolase CwlO-like protein